MVFLKFFTRRASTAVLSYEVNVIPTLNFPAIFIERIIRCDLPVNLRAIACRAERNSEENQKMYSDPKATSGVISETDLFSPNKLNEKHDSFGNISSAPSIEYNSKWGVFGKVCRLDRPCMVDEVHLRRFDGLLVIHIFHMKHISKFMSQSSDNMI